MSDDKDMPASGSRWEPAAGSSDETAGRPDGTPAAPATVPAEHAATPTDAPEVMAEHGAVPVEADRGPRARLPRRLRNRSALAAAGVGLVMAGGIGGFAVGHAIADTDGTEPGISTDADQDGIPDGPRDGDHGGRPDFDRDGSTPDDPNSSPGDDEGGTA